MAKTPALSLGATQSTTLATLHICPQNGADPLMTLLHTLALRMGQIYWWLCRTPLPWHTATEAEEPWYVWTQWHRQGLRNALSVSPFILIELFPWQGYDQYWCLSAIFRVLSLQNCIPRDKAKWKHLKINQIRLIRYDSISATITHTTEDRLPDLDNWCEKKAFLFSV